MANEATAELYTRQSGLNKAKLKTDYDQYLADLASQYGLSTKQLDTNLESRGILRSGEAGESRTRLSAAEEAARTAAKSNYDYNTATEDVDLMTRLAGLQAGSAGSGGSGGGSGGGGGTGGGGGNTGDGSTTPPVLYRSPMDPAFDGMRNRGPRPSVRPERAPGSPGNPNAVRPGTTTPAPAVRPVYGGGTTQGQLPQVALPTPAVRPVRDATPRPAVPATVVNMPRPGTTTPAPRATPAPTPAPVVTPTPARTGTADTMARSAPATPALPDLSGVNWAGLGKMIEDNKKPKPAAVAKPATTRVNPVAARLR